MFDIKKIEAEARAEVNEEVANKAKSLIKAKLQQLNNARKIVANLELEYDVLLKEIGSQAV